MVRYFNTEGVCNPEEHYMVPLVDRLEKIKSLYVDRKKYFVINRGRQYGKTTTLRALAEYLKNEYIVIFMDFQEADSGDFQNESAFAAAFAQMFLEVSADMGMGRGEEMLQPLADFAAEFKAAGLRELFQRLSNLCKKSPRPVVLIIDEVDSAGNNRVFIEFLSLLRRYYLNRDKRPTFHSVILAGVYDIKNLKLKLRSEMEHQYNSPWNIAAKFNLDMCFSANQIETMLSGYEDDHQTGMDVKGIAGEIYQYTSGYPYLVSAVCKILDEELPEKKGFEDIVRGWTREGIIEAVRILLNENIPLFDSMVKQLELYPELRDVITQILYEGREISFNSGAKPVSLGVMFGFLKEKDGYVAVANRIFEMYLLSLFMSEEAIQSDIFKKGSETHY